MVEIVDTKSNFNNLNYRKFFEDREDEDDDSISYDSLDYLSSEVIHTNAHSRSSKPDSKIPVKTNVVNKKQNSNEPFLLPISPKPPTNQSHPEYDSHQWITEEVDLNLGKNATKISLPKFCHVNLTQDESFVSNISKPLLYLQKIPFVSNYCLAIFTNRSSRKQSQIICKVQYCPILQCAYVSGKMRVTKESPREANKAKPAIINEVSSNNNYTHHQPGYAPVPLKFYNQQDYQNYHASNLTPQTNSSLTTPVDRKFYNSGNSSNKDSNYISTRSNSSTNSHNISPNSHSNQNHHIPQNLNINTYNLHPVISANPSTRSGHSILGASNTIITPGTPGSFNHHANGFGVGPDFEKSKTSLLTYAGNVGFDTSNASSRPLPSTRCGSASPNTFSTLDRYGYQDQQSPPPLPQKTITHNHTHSYRNTTTNSTENQSQKSSTRSSKKSKNSKKSENQNLQSEKFCFELRLTRKITNADRYIMRHLWKGHLYIGKSFKTIEPAFEAHVPLDFCIN